MESQSYETKPPQLELPKGSQNYFDIVNKQIIEITDAIHSNQSTSNPEGKWRSRRGFTGFDATSIEFTYPLGTNGSWNISVGTGLDDDITIRRDQTDKNIVEEATIKRGKDEEISYWKSYPNPDTNALNKQIVDSFENSLEAAENIRTLLSEIPLE